ncbi:hypothetical protein BH10CYA1_BH10CYA1_41840 [soil metagenome]
MKNQSDSGDKGRGDTPVLNRDPDLTLNLSKDVGEFEKGYVVADRFKILSLLGKGGMGFVYLVKDKQSGDNFAMKTVSAINTSERIVQRFELEAKATSLIRHPNVIQFHDFGLIDGQQPYFVMDYCEGDTLADLIKSEGALPVDRVLDIFIPISSAVAYAHTQSVVHRDLKPSNIMVKRMPGGAIQVKILDFGIAKVLLDETVFNSLTRTGELFGSPYYMSPEQCVGKTIDTRSDIYSLGCVLFETLTGSPPFISDHPLTTMMKHQSEAPVSLKQATLGREFPEDLEKIVAEMLAKNPDHRYKNLLLVEHDLRLLQRGERLESGLKITRPSRRRFPFEVVGIGVCSSVLACVATYFLLQPPPSGPPPASLDAKAKTAADFRSLDLPDLADMSKSKKSVVTSFFSSPEDLHSKKRRFHFPAKSIGNIGDADHSMPAQGDVVLQIPISFSVGADIGVLSGFRPDEIEHLVMQGPLVDDISTRLFRNWRAVDNLDLNWSDVSDRSIENIQSLPKLKSLNVSSTHISASGLSKLNLQMFHNLEANDIAYVPQILPKTKNVEFEVLKLSNAGLKNSDMKDLAQLHHLLVLDISGNEITDQGVELLVPLQRLQQFWFAGNDVTPKCIESLGKMHGLQGVTLSMTKWTPTEKANFVSAAKKFHCSVSIFKPRDPMGNSSLAP